MKTKLSVVWAGILSLLMAGCGEKDLSREKVIFDNTLDCYIYSDKKIEKHYEEIEEGELDGVIMTKVRILDYDSDPILVIPQTIYDGESEKEVVGISVDAIEDRSIKMQSTSTHFIEIDECIYQDSIILAYVPFEKQNIDIPLFTDIILTYLSHPSIENRINPLAVNIPSTIQDIYIGKVATNIYWNVDNNNPSFSSEKGCLYDKDKSTLIRFYDQEEYVIPASVKKICEYAFYKSKKLKSLTIAPEIKTERDFALEAGININGALSGEFSVSPYKKVHFSQGNLQYQASTNTWRFAQNQYDFIGKANEKISNINEDWIDLFDMGTGNCPTKASYLVSDYSPATFADWGTNEISNGGNKRNQWYTLSAQEWDYILNKRPNAKKLCGHAIIDQKRGYLLLPDNWQLPSGLNFSSKSEHWNYYSLEEWKRMEAGGAVFLPSAGRTLHYAYVHSNGFKTEVDAARECGYYWTTTIQDYNHGAAYELFFGITFIRFYSTYYNEGGSVRLVK